MSVHERVVAEPAPSLRPFVSRYCGFRYEGLPPGTHAGVPSRHLTLMISLGPPIDITAMPDRSQSPGAFPAFVGGLHTTPATVRHGGHGVGIGIDVSPLGARALLGMPASELAAVVAGLDEVWGRHAFELPERLAATGAWAERFRILDETLPHLVREIDRTPPDVVHAWHRLLATGGTLEIGELATEVGWSRRHLSERFRLELGVSPKAAARVLRFERASWLLEQPHPLGLARVAALAGYADQAHLAREWQAIAGQTPTAWRSAELRDVTPGPIAG